MLIASINFVRARELIKGGPAFTPPSAAERRVQIDVSWLGWMNTLACIGGCSSSRSVGLDDGSDAAFFTVGIADMLVDEVTRRRRELCRTP